jgi:hypothetical protein
MDLLDCTMPARHGSGRVTRGRPEGGVR